MAAAATVEPGGGSPSSDSERDGNDFIQEEYTKLLLTSTVVESPRSEGVPSRPGLSPPLQVKPGQSQADIVALEAATGNGNGNALTKGALAQEGLDLTSLQERLLRIVRRSCESQARLQAAVYEDMNKSIVSCIAAHMAPNSEAAGGGAGARGDDAGYTSGSGHQNFLLDIAMGISDDRDDSSDSDYVRTRIQRKASKDKKRKEEERAARAAEKAASVTFHEPGKSKQFVKDGISEAELQVELVEELNYKRDNSCTELAFSGSMSTRDGGSPQPQQLHQSAAGKVDVVVSPSAPVVESPDAGAGPQDTARHTHMPGRTSISTVMQVQTNQGLRGTRQGSSLPRFEILDVWRAAKNKPSLSVTFALQQLENDEHNIFDEAIAKEPTSTAPVRCAKCRLHPYNPKRTTWDILSLQLVIFDLIILPMGFFSLPDHPFLNFMNWLSRIFWTADMPMSFVTGFVTKDGFIEMRMRPILMRYFKSWFCLDCLVVGVDWLEIVASAAAGSMGVARMSKISRIFRILRMIRLLRVARMKEVFGLLMERLDNERVVIIIDVLKLVVMMAAFGHLVACGFYGIASGSVDSQDEEQRSWLIKYGYADLNLGLRYLMSMRWALSQFAGGMDEVTPQSEIENVFAIFIFVLSFWSGAVFLSILTSSMTQLYLLGSQNTQNLTTLRRYLSQNGITKQLALRIHRNAQNSLVEAQRTMPEDSVFLFQYVSEPLKVEMHFEMYSGFLSVHPFFQDYIQAAPPVMHRVCHSAMSVASVSEGDVIFHAGETPLIPRMIFATTEGGSSILQYTTATEKIVISESEWVSEATLWTTWVHRGTMMSIKDNRLYLLDAKEFQRVVTQFEIAGFDPRLYAQEFVSMLNSTDCVTDLQGQIPSSKSWVTRFSEPLRNQQKVRVSTQLQPEPAMTNGQ
eukprot:TRINITY_DN13600_c0_g1_i1.p1 TRINITY_DN13600_c0_g1~~TRINITY_DN13600_c0_g1_i1.p1  ORF type:complete len:913 (+),score=227.83 TRINITY_DN13600_c0_g1_i1:133-2871(+)